MGTYNILKATIQCPRCNQITEQNIEMFFGYTAELLKFKVGDKYIWCEEKQDDNGGRPKNGSIDGEGYSECHLCNKDFFVKVIVRKDLIVDIEFDSSKKPYID